MGGSCEVDGGFTPSPADRRAGPPFAREQPSREPQGQIHQKDRPADSPCTLRAPRGSPSGGGQHPIGEGARECYRAAVSLPLFAIVSLPLAAGAGYYLGGPVAGSVWIGVILLTCVAL